jgi:5,10-methylene-tetrahydrofolate dehydrogenase/methenyl tetrahydrofolate cyclohydrolase
LKEVTSPKHEEVDVDQVIEDDDVLIEQELAKIRPLSHHSSANSLIGETPAQNNFHNQNLVTTIQEDKDGELSDLDVPEVLRGTHTG